MASADILEPIIHQDLVSEPSNPRITERTVHEALVQRVNGIDVESCGAGEEDSFFVADLGEIIRSYRLWRARLPGVQAHYAVKCNTDEMVMRTLGMMGCNFDCASKNEIDLVLKLGFDASRIVYANPCKTNSFIRYAREANVTLTTVDNVQELRKVQAYHPQCRVLIRIATDDETAQCRLSTKFGCTLDAGVNELLPECKALGLHVAGVAFHVGSGAKDFGSIGKAMAQARVLFDKARELGMSMTVLDIGGGFEHATFEQSSQAVKEALERDFPEEFLERYGIEVIAEPGRFMVSRAFTLAANVIARRDMDSASGLAGMLYMNDGVYGNLNCILFDHQTPRARVLVPGGEKRMFSLWGPTCDGLDCISSEAMLESDVQVGDWLYFTDVGAYTSVASTSFNGFSGQAHVTYVNSEAS